MPIETYLCDSPSVFHSLADGHISGSEVIPSTAIWGVGSTPSGELYWQRQGTNTPPDGLHARAVLAYNGGNTQPLWTQYASNVPADHDIWFQTKGTTRADFDVTMSSFPLTRGGTGKVYVFYFNEPEDNMTAATYISRVNDLYASIDAHPRPYVVKAQELNGYRLRPAANFPQLKDYVHPNVQHIGWSLFATAGSAKIVNGHVVAQLSAQTQTDQVTAFMQANAPGVPWGAAAWGFAIPDAYWSDATSHSNRIAWANDTAISLQEAGCTHLMWYDAYGDNLAVGSYIIASDAALLAWWLDPSRAGGQTA